MRLGTEGFCILVTNHEHWGRNMTSIPPSNEHRMRCKSHSLLTKAKVEKRQVINVAGLTKQLVRCFHETPWGGGHPTQKDGYPVEGKLLATPHDHR